MTAVSDFHIAGPARVQLDDRSFLRYIEPEVIQGDFDEAEPAFMQFDLLTGFDWKTRNAVDSGCRDVEGNRNPVVKGNWGARENRPGEKKRQGEDEEREDSHYFLKPEGKRMTSPILIPFLSNHP